MTKYKYYNGNTGEMNVTYIYIFDSQNEIIF